MSDDVPFWKRKRLGEMTSEEWESLCDGCGKCCLLKVEYEDTGEIEATSVACKLLDLKTCQCSDYVQRRRHVPDCIDLANIPDLRKLAWLPSTCAYKLLAEGKDLYWWHYLISGSRATVHEAGISVRNKAISEEDVGDLDRNLQRYVVDWTL